MIKFSLLFLLLSFQSFANKMDYIPYYGIDFYELELDKKLTNSSQAEIILKEILTSYHQKVDNDFDLIKKKCSGNNCYKQIPLKYSYSEIHKNRVRGLVMGTLFADEEGYVKSVYCDKEYKITINKYNVPRIPKHTKFNVEHTWPQSRFSKSHSKETQKTDLHNLYPTDRDVNSTRSSKPFVELPGHNYPINQFDCKLSEENGNAFEHPQSHKGNVARSIFYFKLRYDIKVSDREMKTLLEWNDLDPVDEQDRKRNDLIFKYQKNRNPFVDYPHLAAIYSLEK